MWSCTVVYIFMSFKSSHHWLEKDFQLRKPKKIISALSANAVECIFPNECPGYDIKQSDGKDPVVLEFWGMRSTPLLPLHLDPFSPRMVAPVKVLSKNQIELLDIKTESKQITYAKLNCLK